MTLICLTSNLGVSESAPVGFGETGVPDFVQSVRGYFRPEFFNRLDHVVSFRPLAPEDVVRIVDLELDKAAARTGLVRRSLRLRVDVEARARLAALGFHRTHGARPLKRVLEERVIAPLAVRMASDPSWREREVPVVCEGSAAWHALADRERADAIVLREPAAPAEPRQGDS